ncbi:DUF2971 domain-containing protein [Pseudoalteromonas sp. CNC9-20]|uniref:DUF2971 domain-containing protein n=1 Tax=Pseudoalteromonas sp. CNC9-20 TaxID=2917750 RepID=UPI001EF4BC6B|nr:DUF2971 domain-containing protein [Pseudoalteromonas sp. CNC9-20]MCG7570563.1 DUF2971 domain-containing protein [Pseudoalteromonas sp. CNC9-20]
MTQNKLIYHYCGSEAFMGIVKSRQLWASDITKLNDPSEKMQGYDTIQSLVKKYSDPGSFTFFNQAISGVYVCSFSKVDDLLSQWRGYADDGEGFSLGFDRDALKSIDAEASSPSSSSNPKRRSKIELREVFYDENEFSNYYDQYFNGNLSEKPILGRFGAASDLNEAQGLLKIPFYSEEEEVRAYITYPSIHDITVLEKELGRQVSIRNTKYGLCSYTFITILANSNTSLKRVVLGPKNKSTEVDVERLLRINGYNDVEVSRSEGQYR